MNLNLAPAEYQEVKIIDKKKENKNKTIKQRRNTNRKVNRLIKNITSNNDEDSDDEMMGDFIAKPKMTSLGNKDEHHKKFQDSLKQKEKEFENRGSESDEDEDDEDEDDQSISKETFKNIPKQSPIEQYYKNNSYYQYLPQDNNVLSKHTNEVLTDKLNYMIHLLEEQKDEKTGTLHEELILYGFLGVFIIFLVDSFARVGKYYTR